MKEEVESHVRDVERSSCTKKRTPEFQEGRANTPLRVRRGRGSTHSNSPFGEIVWHEIHAKLPRREFTKSIKTI